MMYSTRFSVLAKRIRSAAGSAVLAASVMCGLCGLSAPLVPSVQASEVTSNISAPSRLVRVGFFASDGYHELDAEGLYSGYGYDLLQMLLRYNNWKYEFIGYNKNWGVMPGMLESGAVDILTLVNRTPAREKIFDFSEKPLGYSATVITTRAGNTRVVPGQYATYDGIRVGLVLNSAHNDHFAQYARNKGFKYTPVYFEERDQLISALIKNKSVDVAVTSNMRSLENETVLDEFASEPYFAAVKKGNKDLLEAFNRGIDQLDVYTPAWRDTLYQRYYSDTNSSVISLSPAERQFLAKLKASRETVRVVFNPELRPYSYFDENDNAKGIAPELFRSIAQRLDLKYEFVFVKDRWEYKSALQKNKAIVDLTSYTDYSLAQRYNLNETDPYMLAMISILYRKGFTPPAGGKGMRLAVVREPTEYMGLNKRLFASNELRFYNSNEECVDAVLAGEVDATYNLSYFIERAVHKDYTHTLRNSILPEMSFSLCFGVSDKANHNLLSVLSKAISSTPRTKLSSIVQTETLSPPANMSFIALCYERPVLVGSVIVALLILSSGIAFLIYMLNTQKQRVASMNELSRFRGYVCDAFNKVTELDLSRGIRIEYIGSSGNVKVLVHPLIHRNPSYYTELLHPEDVERVKQHFSDASLMDLHEKLRRGEDSSLYFEARVVNGHGDYDWCAYTIKAVRPDKANPCSVVVFKKNIEDAKRNESRQKATILDALETAKKASAAKGLFLSRVSHEIRTPLNAIIGYVELAKIALNNPTKVGNCLTNSGIAARHLLALINDVLDISSIESGRMKVDNGHVDLKAVLTDLGTLFFNEAQKKKVAFEVRLHDLTEESLIADAMRLKQILSNLLSNAIKFTPENGKVTLTVSQVKVDRSTVYLKFRISDTGIGMSDEFKSRMFKPFEQENAVTAQKYGGTGLGLSIAHNLVDMLGGNIEVESELGKGTTFTVLVHFERDTAAANLKHGTDYSHLRVLVIDDDADYCEYAKNLFARCKIKGDIVQDAKSGVRRLKGRQGTEFAYDLVLLDWNMPGQNGLETARAIRSGVSATIPIVIVSSGDPQQIKTAMRDIAFSSVVSKPLFQSTMFDILVNVFGNYVPEDKTSDPVNSEAIKGLRVLYAEDNPMNMEIGVDLMTRAGLVVEKAWNGREAYDMFLARQADYYDAILMDIQMPEMDGYEATETIRASTHSRGKTIPIIALTANAFSEDVSEALSHGMDAHIAKPVNFRTLYDTLSRLCRRDRAARKAAQTSAADTATAKES